MKHAAGDPAVEIAIDQIILDGGTQPRAFIDPTVVNDYSEAMVAGAKFPPVVVFYDGEKYWLADGFHRLKAAYHEHMDMIHCEVRQGTLDDARWYSFSANKTNGLRRTNEDKQRAVQAALLHPKGAGLSNSTIAAHVGVDESTVRVWREKLTASSGIPKIDTRSVTRKGTTYQQNTANIGRRDAPPPAPAAEPEPAAEREPSLSRPEGRCRTTDRAISASVVGGAGVGGGDVAGGGGATPRSTRNRRTPSTRTLTRRSMPSSRRFA